MLSFVDVGDQAEKNKEGPLCSKNVVFCDTSVVTFLKKNRQYDVKERGPSISCFWAMAGALFSGWWLAHPRNVAAACLQSDPFWDTVALQPRPLRSQDDLRPRGLRNLCFLENRFRYKNEDWVQFYGGFAYIVKSCILKNFCPYSSILSLCKWPCFYGSSAGRRLAQKRLKR